MGRGVSRSRTWRKDWRWILEVLLEMRWIFNRRPGQGYMIALLRYCSYTTLWSMSTLIKFKLNWNFRNKINLKLPWRWDLFTMDRMVDKLMEDPGANDPTLCEMEKSITHWIFTCCSCLWINPCSSWGLLKIMVHTFIAYIAARLVRMIMRCNVVPVFTRMNYDRTTLTITCSCCNTILGELSSYVQNIGSHRVWAGAQNGLWERQIVEIKYKRRQMSDKELEFEKWQINLRCEKYWMRIM